MTYRLTPPLLLLVLAGCSASGRGFPSLAARPAETRGWTEAKPPAPPLLVDDTVLDAKIVTISASLAVSRRAFDAADKRITPVIQMARHDAAGSQRWIAAQSALADLDSQRAVGSDSATALEDLAATRVQALQPDYPALETARAQATTLLDQEAARIKTLQAMIAAG